MENSKSTVNYHKDADIIGNAPFPQHLVNIMRCKGQDVEDIEPLVNETVIQYKKANKLYDIACFD